MTSPSSTASGAPAGAPALSPAWRAQVAAAQEAALPDATAVVSCAAPYGAGGLGRHMREIVEALQRRGQRPLCLSGDRGEGRRWEGRRTSPTAAAMAAMRPALRFSPAWRLWSESVRFDAEAARQLPEARHLIAFNGTARRQFDAAARMGYSTLSLVSATSHFRRVARQHARACSAYPFESSWAARLLERNLAEYARAERILVSTRHILGSFLEEGFAEDRLCVFPLMPDARFTPPVERKASATFDVVYTGGLSVVKGVPVLVEAMRQLDAHDLRLVLVGGWGTRGMRRYIERACASDARVVVARGDPLAYLRSARLYVHPSYEDGFGYATAEALACGVPVIVSENTGAKELIEPGRNGLVVATGDVRALAETIDAAYRGELFRT